MPVTAQHAPNYPDAETVWRELHGPLLGFIARRVPDRDAAEDILQDVMLRIHRHADELLTAAPVDGWIYAITRNAIIDHYRRAATRRERPTGEGLDLDSPAPDVPDPGPEQLRTELAACLEPLLAQLPPSHRDALRLTDLEGLTLAEAATRVGLSTSGMKARVRRARARLKLVFTRCCEIELDRRGSVIDYRAHDDTCDCSADP